MKKILILGSTGSIGTQTLEVVGLFPKQFEVVGLSAYSNDKLLFKQQQKFNIKSICLRDDDLTTFVQKNPVDIVVIAVNGQVGLSPTLAALQMGQDVALATKEVLVVAGDQVMQCAKENNAQVRPIDSEHSAIWQCLRGENIQNVHRVWLTCSGGPFRDADQYPIEKLKNITPEEAIQHPNWNMGKKISVDSATLMNKALELIEAVHLFGVSPEKIEVVIHPESLLHSAVEFVDGSIIGQVGTPDMRIPIAHALFAPGRSPLPFPRFDFVGKKFTFESVDEDRFPSLQFAREALKNNRCAEMNLANEKAVREFLSGKIGFLDIFEHVKKSLI